jgi:hypothetical protein
MLDRRASALASRTTSANNGPLTMVNGRHRIGDLSELAQP